MPVSAALRRLLRIRDLEEEQLRVVLESAMADLHALEQALAAARKRQRRGRERVGAARDAAEHISALVESESGAMHTKTLGGRVADAEREAARLRQQYLSKRIERRQAETLIREAEARDAAEEARRAQQGHDDWFGGRRQRVLHRSEDSLNSPRPETKEL